MTRADFPIAQFCPERAFGPARSSLLNSEGMAISQGVSHIKAQASLDQNNRRNRYVRFVRSLDREWSQRCILSEDFGLWTEDFGPLCRTVRRRLISSGGCDGLALYARRIADGR